ncbi:hypothetical protein NWF32_11455 [Pseudomonas qingdaonensis]|nr:hypothetical protein [Pseudomonas qingdaonensis]
MPLTGAWSATPKICQVQRRGQDGQPSLHLPGRAAGYDGEPEDGLWCSYHFIPGNYNDPAGTPSREETHGAEVANYLPKFTKRDTFGGEQILRKYNASKVKDLQYGKMLNRPQSALSRRLVQDAVLCATDDDRLRRSSAWPSAGQKC